MKYSPGMFTLQYCKKRLLYIQYNMRSGKGQKITDRKGRVPMSDIRKHFYFSGRVQGVGFRYRSYYIAQALGLTGWVKNLWDDRVEMELQGDREIINEMIEQLGRQSYVEIDGIEEKQIPVEMESSFRIR